MKSLNFVSSCRDVLPTLLQLLSNLSKESYLKDKGACYRYTQAFKLQENLTKNLSKVLIYLDSIEDDFQKASAVVVLYLSSKQPAPLQVFFLLSV